MSNDRKSTPNTFAPRGHKNPVPRRAHQSQHVIPSSICFGIALISRATSRLCGLRKRILPFCSSVILAPHTPHLHPATSPAPLESTPKGAEAEIAGLGGRKCEETQPLWRFVRCILVLTICGSREPQHVFWTHICHGTGSLEASLTIRGQEIKWSRSLAVPHLKQSYAAKQAPTWGAPDTGPLPLHCTALFCCNTNHAELS
eukprot:scaffold48_cov311-Pinguiococcus_pyrenoidosus.AAC.288